ncbi:hypothetical protein NQ317_008945 [Molorchus minor]|uniref:DUF4729 domain-containing protein n=1 Tax=Molorchus minor TaxID=1323400 RepID=A0ABQ9K0Z1_9CUCU|nr:hypothetical protein NQ317_008945 [Molorchus minor]
MEHPTHWATMVKCSLCGGIPESAPLFQCPLQHLYCSSCTVKLKKNYKGSIKGGSMCTICHAEAVFGQSKINTDFLNKIRAKPGIGRPYRYSINLLANKDYNYSRTHPNESEEQPEVTVEELFQLPADEIRKLLNRRHESTYADTPSATEPFGQQSSGGTIRTHGIASTSKLPIKCPHNPCSKMVAVSSFVSHFKHEHAEIPKYNIERGKELCIPCNVSVVEHGINYCIAMITVYEINKIDVKKSRSSQSVIKTCSKFCQQVPINSFWLMATGSVERKSYCSYALFWLFTTADENYQSTIEMSSKHDSLSLSTYCGVKNVNFANIVESLNCLLVSKASFGAILKEGPEVNLRITVH